MNTPVLGVILAGGEAKRMGGQAKGMLPLHGQSLIAHIADRLRDQVAGLAINVRGPGEAYGGLGLPLIPDAGPPDRAEGPLAGVLAGLRYAHAQGYAQIVTLPCDTPLLPRDLVAGLRAAQQAAHTHIAVASSGQPPRWHHAVSLCDCQALPGLEAAFLAGERALRRAYGRLGSARAHWPIHGIDPFFNINRAEDLAELQLSIG